MINFSFDLRNPWSRRWKNVINRSFKTPFANKFLEVELIEDNTILSFTFQLTARTDHGGLSMGLGFLSYSISFNFYDNRHWNKDTGHYFIYDNIGEKK